MDADEKTELFNTVYYNKNKVRNIETRLKFLEQSFEDQTKILMELSETIENQILQKEKLNESLKKYNISLN
jgi:uncharacterized coiled-coil protein SlyX